MSRPRTSKKNIQSTRKPWGENLIALRHQFDWTQSELANRLGVNLSQISRIESGRYPPKIELLIELTKLFQVSADELLTSPSQRTQRDKDTALLVDKLRLLNDDQFEKFMRATTALLDGYTITVHMDPIAINDSFSSMLGPEKVGKQPQAADVANTDNTSTVR